MGDLFINIFFIICVIYMWLCIAIPIIGVVMDFIRGEKPDDNIRKIIYGVFYLIVVPIILIAMLILLF